MGEDDEETESPGNFNKKSVWARISVIAAGPIFNFIMAFVLAVILTAMVGYDKPVISSVEEGYSAADLPAYRRGRHHCSDGWKED